MQDWVPAVHLDTYQQPVANASYGWPNFDAYRNHAPTPSATVYNIDGNRAVVRAEVKVEAV